MCYICVMEYTEDDINNLSDYEVNIDADCVIKDYDDADYYQHLYDDKIASEDNCNIEFE